MMLKTLPALAAAFVASHASAQVTFDFEGVIDNNDGTVSNSSFTAADGASGLAITTDVNGSNALQATVSDTDGFANLISNFGTPQLFEQGGTLTGDAVFTNLGANFTSGGNTVDPAVAGPQVFLARQGTNTGYDLTDSDDNDDNFNFVGDQTLNQVFSFAFTLPAITGTNNVDAGGFYGITLGASDVGAGATVSFDNVTFTPIPEPASAMLVALGGAALLGRRRK